MRFVVDKMPESAPRCLFSTRAERILYDCKLDNMTCSLCYHKPCLYLTEKVEEEVKNE